MAKTEKPKIQRKTFLNLWWKYLKRSAIYKEYCESSREDNKEESLPKQFTIPVKFEETGDIAGVVDPQFLWNWYNFGDVHRNSFEKWWRGFKKVDKTEAENIQGVETYNIKQEIDSCIESFKKSYGREPTLQEFKDELLYLTNNYDVSYLKINFMAPSTKEDLIKQLCDFVRNKLIDSFIRISRAAYHLTPFTVTKYRDSSLRADELKRYLQVYDLDKKDVDMKDIVKIVKPEKNCDSVNVIRAFNLDLERANNIIENVEQGIFPGDYQPKKRKKRKKRD